jgi:hypothetical protein
MDTFGLGSEGRADAKSHAQPVQLQIIATTEPGTRAALVKARQLSRRLSVNRMILLVPRIGSSNASFEGPTKDAATIEDYRRMAGATGLDVIVRLCVCDRYSEAFQWMLPRKALVVVGGRRRWWWPTREQRIADQLKKAGHEIAFADASGS